MQWYYNIKGKQQGPVSQEKLIELREKGEIKGTDLIWNETMENWLPFAKVLESSSISDEAQVYQHKNLSSSTVQVYAVISLVTGLLSTALACVACLGIFTAPVGIVFGYLALKENPNPQDRVLAIAGLVSSIIGLLFSLAPIVFYILIILIAIIAEIANL